MFTKPNVINHINHKSTYTYVSISNTLCQLQIEFISTSKLWRHRLNVKLTNATWTWWQHIQVNTEQGIVQHTGVKVLYKTFANESVRRSDVLPPGLQIGKFVFCVHVSEVLPHWGRVTHICVSKLTIIGWDNGLSPNRRQGMIWTNAGILLIGPSGTKIIEILIKIHSFSVKKMHLKLSSAKWRPFGFDLNVLSNGEKRLAHKIADSMIFMSTLRNCLDSVYSEVFPLDIYYTCEGLVKRKQSLLIGYLPPKMLLLSARPLSNGLQTSGCGQQQ